MNIIKLIPYSLSYRYFMDNNLFYHINIPKENINFLNGNAKNPLDECENYEKKLNLLKVLTVKFLGIGVNGHIAFANHIQLLIVKQV